MCKNVDILVECSWLFGLAFVRCSIKGGGGGGGGFLGWFLVFWPPPPPPQLLRVTYTV
ncbi:hypothetical protein [Bartonella sp. LJL80]